MRKLFSKFNITSNRIPGRDVERFYHQLALLLDAGVDLGKALSIATERAKPALRKVIHEVLEKITGGQSFADVLGEYPRIFPPLVVAMVRLGEANGRLEESLREAAQHLEETRELRHTIIRTLTYPTIVLAVAVVSVGILFAFVIPTFELLFANFHVGMPPASAFLFLISNWINANAIILLIAIAGVIVAALASLRRPRVREFLERVILRIPLLGPSLNFLILTRVTRALGRLLSQGVSPLEAIESAADLSGNSRYRQALLKVKHDLTEGLLLSETMAAHNCFPPSLIQMVTVGEESGHLDTVLLQGASMYDQEARNALGAFTAWLEPMATLSVGAVVAVIVVSMILPMMDLMNKVI